MLLMMVLLFLSCSKSVVNNEEKGSSIGLNKQDSLVMVKYHESMGGFGWDLKDCNTWKSVGFVYDEKTGQNYVNKIVFGVGFMKQKGTIPKEIGQLSKLEYFMIQDNRGFLQGELPNEIFNCPLIKFRVEGDRLYGTLDSSIGKIANTIVSFWISGTAIGGQLPSEFGLFQNLETCLYLYHNLFSGELPKTFTSIPKGVVLVDNYISSVDWLFFDIDIESSWAVVLKGNRLDGEIPDKVLNSPVWKKWHYDFANQQEGFGFSNYLDWLNGQKKE